ncbi:MAG: phosphoenolpyruvate synthase, partial [Candidatus Aenigmarchaeota archaeon]|nr:phosphoenolpyruvate synthase [Candidatus Aenigmarchaeota archaeon]
EKGKIYRGKLAFSSYLHDVKDMKKTKTKIFVNIADPSQAGDISLLPVDGVGLAREEFIISSCIGKHPMRMIKEGKSAEYAEKLFSGIAKIAASFYPRPVIIRFSDFKTNEYRNLEGGKDWEKEEENPMIGLRGASRYFNERFEKAFRLECRAIKKCGDYGIDNIKVMVPFCRTIDEAIRVKKIIKQEGLKCEIGVMAEIPSNVILAKEFAKHFDFFSIGSNDLTQLTLGMDRDNASLSFDERDEAVKILISQLIKEAHKMKRPVGICGEAPSNYPEFVRFLLQQKIDSISVNPDAAMRTKLLVVKMEK